MAYLAKRRHLDPVATASEKRRTRALHPSRARARGPYPHVVDAPSAATSTRSTPGLARPATRCLPHRTSFLWHLCLVPNGFLPDDPNSRRQWSLAQYLDSTPESVVTDTEVVYTDGSAKTDELGSRAGFGIYWGPRRPCRRPGRGREPLGRPTG
jgi:hypothetical protein